MSSYIIHFVCYDDTVRRSVLEILGSRTGVKKLMSSYSCP